MNKLIAAGAVAALAGVASAQEVTIYFDALGLGGSDQAADSLLVGSGNAPIDWQVSIEITDPTGFGVDPLIGGLDATGSPGLNGFIANDTSGNGGSVTDVIPSAQTVNAFTFQALTNDPTIGLSIPNVSGGTNFFGNPVDIGLFLNLGTFTATPNDLANGSLSYDFQGVGIQIFEEPVAFAGSVSATPVVVTDTVAVPAPASAGLLGFAGLAAARRRR